MELKLDPITIFLAAMQIVNFIVTLKVRNAVLESETKTMDKAEKKFVQKEYFHSVVRRLEKTN